MIVKEPGAMAKGLCLDPTAGASSTSSSGSAGAAGASSSFDSASLLPVLLVLGLPISATLIFWGKLCMLLYTCALVYVSLALWHNLISTFKILNKCSSIPCL